MSITGTWNLTLTSPLGEQSARLDVTEAEGALQATLTGKGDPTPAQGFAFSDNQVSFSADADTPVGRLNLAFSGTIEGDKLSGKYQTPFGGFDFSGTRA